ncbi:alpha/beta fold hydrolase [Paracraurococcus ruber]|uniref:Alpha/beta hydrolase n=2 Tax=Paracraurococcus ruber TaxID=77675 RepID=A0ABS1CRT1_9PROT|nr:alpha/beta fold hydrolase [Paracraurococcus ruber]MBK1657158.1 alpha/beta hydrolase [Paracraurococcus ruber]TDG31132.1 alpha/beta fold hydrolase [Paracraurococcus ruber]
MHRRAMLAAPALAGPLLAPLPVQAQGAGGQLVTEEFMVPAKDAGIELFLRNKRPEAMTGFSPARTLLMVHGATYPAHTAFDLPLGGLSWMDYIAGRGFDVWCLDIRGYGRSTRPPEMAQPANANPPIVRGDTAVADIASAAAFIRQRRNLPRLTQLGYSWGTALMGRFAADNPSLVERLVLYAPVWLRTTPSLADPGGELGAYRSVTVEAARRRRGTGVPADKAAALIPPGWFEHWAGVTWATDPEGSRQNPPVIRAPNGSTADGREFWSAGKPFYDPAKITAPTLLVLGEWDQDTPPYMAQALFPLLTASPGKRLVLLGEGTHGMWMERNRGALFQAVQVFLEEATA